MKKKLTVLITTITIILSASLPARAQLVEWTLSPEFMSKETPAPVLYSVIIRSLLERIGFERADTAFTKSSYPQLDSLAIVFKENSDLQYEIQGHTDSRGDAMYNLLLSAARAGAVKNYVISKGVPEANIIAVGYGSERPVASNDTETGRAENRRLEVVVIGSDEKYAALKQTEEVLREEIKKVDIKEIARETEPKPQIIAAKPEPVKEQKTVAAEPKPVVKAAAEEEKKERGSRFKFGVRGAYNNSFAANMKITRYEYDDIIIMKEHGHKIGLSHGFHIESVVLINIINDSLDIKLSPGVIYRKPFVSEITEASEWAITIPAMMQLRMYDTPVKLLGGFQLDIPLGTEMKWDSGPSYEIEDRSPVDFGIVLGACVYIRKNVFVDFKYNFGLIPFLDGKSDHRLNQISVGAGVILFEKR